MPTFNSKTLFIFLLLAAFFTVGLTMASDFSFYILIAVLALLVLLFFILYPEFGIYLMAFLYPFIYLEFVYQDLDIPYVDLIGLVLLLAWGFRILYLNYIKKEKIRRQNFPAWFFMLLFALATAASLLNVDREWLSLSIKYIFRPILFFYLVYVILPFNIIDSFKKLYNTFKVLFVLGLTLSLMGIWSLIFPPSEGLRRAIPFAIAGVYPLGTNHNLLAEILIALIPVALILFWQEKDIFWKNIYLLGALLMMAINLLTLSRSGWLALFMELLILAWLKYRKEVKHIFGDYLFYFILVLFLPILYLMYTLFTSQIISTSNLNRLKLIEIALTLFKEHPLFGQGIGTFTNILAGIQWYIMEYGGVLDAHGFIFKTLAETGLFGTITYLALLGYILYVTYQGYKKSKTTEYSWLILGMLLAVVGVIVFQFFGTSYFLGKMWLPIGLALASLKLTKLKFAGKSA